jgi:hypothetical protein
MEERFWDKLKYDRSPVLCGCQPQQSLEMPVQVALVAEPSGEGNLADAGICFRQLPAGVLNAQLTQVLPRSASESPAKDTSEMNRMDIDGVCDVGQFKVFSEAFVQQFLGVLQPAR